MNSAVKVVKKSIRGWLSPSLDEDLIATEIQEQENQGWQLASSFGACLKGRGFTDTLVFIYRKK
jgi:hypothetical protein